ncbi:Rz-like spanin [Pseudomonas phage PPpW-4]|uniref:Putative endopeptidase n=1 Tax=Pseudomonas phage PPpW-4 TaxID=1279083 RepID=V5YTV9_9CAUD|nr:Rz-like spanin [Pseudomonas phage PPpW-4]BAO20714.1 putative endopeptidase [Pseudomonas phage PPpW-4]
MSDFLIRVGAFLAALFISYQLGVSEGTAETTQRLAESHRIETQRLKEARDETQSELDATARNWAAAAAESEKHAAGTVATLRRDGIRLSVQLADRTIESVEGYNRGLADGRAELHPETATALVRITEDADRQVKALQETVRAVTQ